MIARFLRSCRRRISAVVNAAFKVHRLDGRKLAATERTVKLEDRVLGADTIPPKVPKATHSIGI